MDARCILVSAIFQRNGAFYEQLIWIALLKVHCIVPDAVLGLGGFVFSMERNSLLNEFYCIIFTECNLKRFQYNRFLCPKGN